MSANYIYTGTECGRRIGHATKRDALAIARRYPAGRVIRVDFGRLYGRNWVAIIADSDCRIIAADGTLIPATFGWDGQRNAIRLRQPTPPEAAAGTPTSTQAGRRG